MQNAFEFFFEMEQILGILNPSEKIAAVFNLRKAFENCIEFQYNHSSPPKIISTPSYATSCTIVHGAHVERRRRLDTIEGRGVFLHAIAHIEYSAVDLALDTCYRFRHLPSQYYEDWLAVAFDEAQHFVMLRELLTACDVQYGTYAVHTGIFDAMKRSQNSLRQRMAATHRYLEAGGLDAHPDLEQKFARFDDPLSLKIRAALRKIYEEEIDHVRKGDFWFRYACGQDQESLDIFRSDVESAIPGVKFGNKKFNVEARRRAGFIEAEIESLFQAKPRFSA